MRYKKQVKKLIITIYYFKTKGSGKINFIKFKGPFGLFKEARD